MKLGKSVKHLRLLPHDQRGITGLETAIVLIAILVVSPVFAFATRSTGLGSNDKAMETIQSGLEEARSTLESKGSVTIIAAPFGGGDSDKLLEKDETFEIKLIKLNKTGSETD